MTVIRYAHVPGVVLEPLADSWAAYSPIAGGSHLLNDSGAAVLEILAEHGDLSTEQLAHVVGTTVGLPAADIAHALMPLWGELVASGLVREVPAPAGV